MADLRNFHSVGTDEGRAITWRLWGTAPGDRLIVATLSRAFEVVVLKPARACDHGESLLVSVDGVPKQLILYRSTSSGYYDRNPGLRFPGCDRDLDFDGVSAKLLDASTAHLELPRAARASDQLELFG